VLRGELIRGLEVAQEIDSMAKASGVQMLLTAADHAVGYTHFWRGEFHDALARAEAGMARFDAEVEQAIMQTFQLSSSTAIRTFRACSLWMLGHEETARQAFEDTLEFAHSLNHPPSTAYCFGTAGQTLTMQRNWLRLAEIASRGKQYSDEEGYELWSTVAEVQAGLARAYDGDVESGLGAMQRGRESFLSTRTVITDAMHHPAVGELLIAAEQYDACIGALTEAIAGAERRGERNYLSEIYRVRGTARQKSGDSEGAQLDFERAIAIATEQGAVPLIRWAEASFDGWKAASAELFQANSGQT
jgi:tetratricopeptide (TPR) repeat protein